MSTISFFFIFIPLLALILLLVNIIFAVHNPYQEKDSPFECGYHSFLGQNRTQFNITFYIFGLCFLVFDLEILLLYPYAVSAYSNDIYGLIIALAFVLLLTIGLIYELGKGVLSIDSRQSLFSLRDINTISNSKLLNSKDELFKLSRLSTQLVLDNGPKKKFLIRLRDNLIKNFTPLHIVLVFILIVIVCALKIFIIPFFFNILAIDFKNVFYKYVLIGSIALFIKLAIKGVLEDMFTDIFTNYGIDPKLNLYYELIELINSVWFKQRCLIPIKKILKYFLVVIFLHGLLHYLNINDKYLLYMYFLFFMDIYSSINLKKNQNYTIFSGYIIKNNSGFIALPLQRRNIELSSNNIIYL